MLLFCFLHSKLHINHNWRWHLLSMWRHGGQKFIVGTRIFIFSTGQRLVLSLTNRPLYLRRKNRLSCWIVSLEGFRDRLEALEQGEVLGPTDIQNTTVRLSSQYHSYCTNWAIHSNAHEFVYWLSRMFISCWFVPKLTEKKLFLLIECFEF